LRSILLLTVPMDGYESELIKALEKRGFCVDWFRGAAKISKADLSLMQRLIRTLVEDLKISFLERFLDDIEEKIYGNRISKLRDKYDVIFDFAGKARPNCLRNLRRKYSCEFILFLWDDLKHNKLARKSITFFNKVYTFSKNDARNFNLRYRPNFFLSNYLYRNEPKQIDVFYRGTARNRQRSIILSGLINAFFNYEIDVSLLVKGGYIRNYFKVTDGNFFKMYCTKNRLSGAEMAEKSKRARVLLDIAFDNQSGLGLRPIEALAANCKIVTTNRSILDYDIYNSSNSFLLKKDFSNIEDLKKFLTIPLEVPSQKIIYKYSVEGFVDDLFYDLISSKISKHNEIHPILE
jgi:hypothetical protein